LHTSGAKLEKTMDAIGNSDFAGDCTDASPPLSLPKIRLSADYADYASPSPSGDYADYASPSPSGDYADYASPSPSGDYASPSPSGDYGESSPTMYGTPSRDQPDYDYSSITVDYSSTENIDYKDFSEDLVCVKHKPTPAIWSDDGLLKLNDCPDSRRRRLRSDWGSCFRMCYKTCKENPECTKFALGGSFGRIWKQCGIYSSSAKFVLLNKDARSAAAYSCTRSGRPPSVPARSPRPSSPAHIEISAPPSTNISALPPANISAPSVTNVSLSAATGASTAAWSSALAVSTVALALALA